MHQAIVRRHEPGKVLNVVEGADAVDRLLGNRGLLGDPIVVELPAAMRPARHLKDPGVGDEARFGLPRPV
jgi:hypothetical protein